MFLSSHNVLPVCCPAVEFCSSNIQKYLVLLTSVIFSQISKSSLLKSTVVMKVFDFNRFAKHDIIGELRFQLSGVDWNHVIEEWQDLAEPTKLEVEEQS